MLADFQSRLIELNVEMLCRQKVTAVVESENGVNIEFGDGTETAASMVIVATAPEAAQKLLPQATIKSDGQAYRSCHAGHRLAGGT